MIGEWRFGSQRAKYDETREFALFKINEDDLSRSHITFEGDKTLVNRIPQGQPLPCPSFKLNHEQQQALMDELWAHGFKPNARRYDEEINSRPGTSRFWRASWKS